MISVGSRDDERNKELSLRYGGIEGGKMDLESEFEEGEAYFHNNKYDYDDDDDYNDDGNDDDSTIDPDISLSYIDEKIQHVLGHCQKEFEGGVSAEKLGAKFGGYGSFLPTYQRSPVLPRSKTPPNALTYSAPISPNNAFVEVGHQNPVSQSSASQPARHGPAPPRRPNMNGRSKQDGPTSSITTHGAKSTSNGPQTVNNDGSDPKSLKVRIRVGPDNSSTRRNAEIYSGLGLDVSPSSSLEISPVDSDGFFHVPRDGPDESPTSILEMMTSFPICGSRLLSPLPYDVLHLTEKKSEDSICGPVHKTSQESTVTALHGSDSGKPDQTAPGEKPKSSETNTVSMESTNGIDVRNDNETGIITKTETEQVNGNNKGSAGKAREATEENNSGFPMKADSDVSSGSKTRYVKRPREGEKDRKFHDGMKSSHGSKTSSSLDGKRKPKNHVDGSKSGKSNHVSKSVTEDFKKSSGNVGETYKEFFGELDLDLEKRSRNEKGTVENKVVKKSEKPSLYPRGGSHVPLVGNGVGSGAGVTTVVGPVVNEDWVCCDKCEKWRLLPPGVNPGSLPEKWLCSMLDWLPGMNRCSISEEETTRAITSRFPGPSLVQGSQPVHPGGPQLDASCPEGRNRHLGSEIPPSSVKKKHESKDLTNEAKQERPSLSSNSAKKNLHTSYKSRSLNGGNRSPRVNESEVQDSGQSRDVIAEKDGLKRKENDKLCENVVDEGNNIHQPKANNKRANTQDFPRDFKKAKTDAIHGPDEDRISGGGTVFKPSCSSSSGLPPGITRKDHGKLDRRPKDTKPTSKDVTKKRKLNEFEGTRKHVKEASENNGRKEKKSRVLSKSNDEGKNVTVAATSSSSKVSGSRKTKPDNEETKGSPVESVSSSPLRILSTDKLMSSKRNEIIEPANKDKEKIEPFSGFPGGGVGTSGHGNRAETTSSHGHNSNGPRSRKHGKGSASRSSKEKNRSRYEITEKGTPQISEPLNKNVDSRASQEKPKEGRKPDKLVNGAKTSLDPKQLSKRDVSGKGKSQSLPPKGQNGIERLPEPIPGYPKENVGKPNKKAHNLNGKQPINPKNPTPNGNGSGNKDAPLTVVRDISNQRDIANQATTTALREATNLKHMADRMKNSGSSLESRALYIQAALKFLHVASLFETCHSQTGRYGDMIQSVSIYGSTAKLCEYCAHEYERTKEMATASLAYKCMEVAYLKVIYSSHTTACKDVNELQTSLPLGPTGESPSSSASASDLDNMNNPTTVDKAALPKGLNAPPQAAGNHVITARNKPNFMRILNFTQDVNSAMEAARKSRSCFAASNAKEEAIQSAVKKALDFNFHDVKELLRLVRVAMEVINR